MEDEIHELGGLHDGEFGANICVVFWAQLLINWAEVPVTSHRTSERLRKGQRGA